MGTEPGSPPLCVAECKADPVVGMFSLVLEQTWGDPALSSDNVMMAPVVAHLDDDNCDGTVDGRDIPEIIFLSFEGNDYNNRAGTSAVLRVISVVGGEVVSKLNVTSTLPSPDWPVGGIAAGDINGDGFNEIVTCTTDNRVRAYDRTGTELWLGPAGAARCSAPALADLDRDGAVEVIDRNGILDGASGTLEHPLNSPGPVVPYDLDGDGLLDLVAAGALYDGAGSEILDTLLPAGEVAIGDLDSDGIPEVVAVDSTTHTLSIWRRVGPTNFEFVRQGLDLHAGLAANPCCLANPSSIGCTRGGGAPVVADFNGDGSPDVGVAAGAQFVAYDGAKLTDGAVADADTVLWTLATSDCGSAQTGSSAFDFDGDGAAELVYADEQTLGIYDGASGSALVSLCNTNGTVREYPVVADVDRDGRAELIAPSNAYSGLSCTGGTKTTGIRIFGDDGWVGTRSVWNEYGYHVTNVDESGAIPVQEQANHGVAGLNHFRQNASIEGQQPAPDLTVSLWYDCGTSSLHARVLNVGEASVDAGVDVGFYDGVPATGTPLGQATTVTRLVPLAYEDVVLPAAPPSLGAHAVVDDGGAPHAWQECRIDNNVSRPAALACVE